MKRMASLGSNTARHGWAWAISSWAALVCLGFVLLAGPALGQPPPPPAPSLGVQGIGGGQLNFRAPRDVGGDILTVAARIQSGPNGQPELIVSAKINAGWHIYSVTQKPGGPKPTKIDLTGPAGFALAGTPTAAPAAESHQEPLFGGLTVESHAGQVAWTVPIAGPAGTDWATAVVSGKVNAQGCTDMTCNPPRDFAFEARWQGPPPMARTVAKAAPATTTGAYAVPGAHVVLRGQLDRGAVAPGDTLRFTLRAEPRDGFHLYAWAERDPVEVSKPTLIAFQELNGWRAAPPRTNPAPLSKPGAIAGGPPALVHKEPVEWAIDIFVPTDTLPGRYSLSGLVGIQTCTEERCDAPSGAQFRVDVTVGEGPSAAVPLTFTPAPGKYAAAAKLAATGPDGGPAQVKGVADMPPAPPVVANGAGPVMIESPTPVTELFGTIVPQEFGNLGSGARSLQVILLSAFLGGFILNFMPCVLPVIGLKILGFVQQSRDSRGRIFMLNVWYTLGLLSVFMILATMATAFNKNWGEQFGSTWFNIAMASVVFAMALSFLGVWEIPIPGFVGSGTANDLAAKEGAPGAFAKGVLTTVLATPCSGPFLGPVFFYALTQRPAITYAIFACVGLGLASPYLLIGAFPRLIRFLPKPGAWMDTFKHLMGFVLLATVVFLFTFMQQDYVVPTFALLVGIWAACWWIGHTPLTAHLGQKLRAWGMGAAAIAATALVAFNYLLPGKELLEWEPFSPQRLAQLTQSGHTVLVDFTADWCLNCKTNEALALNTPEVSRAVQRNNVVTLKADFTDTPPDIKDMLALLHSRTIPVTAVFPATRPNEPLVLRDLISKRQVLEALQAAGPSQPSPAVTARK